MASPYEDLVRRAAAKYGVRPELALAVMRTESGGDPTLVSKVGAAGLMQLMPSTQKQHGVSDPFDPEQNVDAGVRHLANYLKRYNGDEDRALAAYNLGPGKVPADGPLPPHAAQKYVPTVRKNMPGVLSGQEAIDYARTHGFVDGESEVVEMGLSGEAAEDYALDYGTVEDVAKIYPDISKIKENADGGRTFVMKDGSTITQHPHRPRQTKIYQVGTDPSGVDAYMRGETPTRSAAGGYRTRPRSEPPDGRRLKIFGEASTPESILAKMKAARSELASKLGEDHDVIKKLDRAAAKFETSIRPLPVKTDAAGAAAKSSEGGSPVPGATTGPTQVVTQERSPALDPETAALAQNALKDANRARVDQLERDGEIQDRRRDIIDGWASKLGEYELRYGQHADRMLQQFRDTSDQLEAIKARIESSEINPDRLFERMSTTQQALAFLGMGLSRFATFGTRGAMQMIDKAIDRDLAVQRAEIGKSIKLANMTRQQADRAWIMWREIEDQRRSVAKDQATMELAGLAAESGRLESMAKVKELIAKNEYARAEIGAKSQPSYASTATYGGAKTGAGKFSDSARTHFASLLQGVDDFIRWSNDFFSLKTGGRAWGVVSGISGGYVNIGKGGAVQNEIGRIKARMAKAITGEARLSDFDVKSIGQGMQAMLDSPGASHHKFMSTWASMLGNLKKIRDLYKRDGFDVSYFDEQIASLKQKSAGVVRGWKK